MFYMLAENKYAIHTRAAALKSVAVLDGGKKHNVKRNPVF